MTIADELGCWLDARWDPDLTVRDWWALLAAEHWSTPEWPTRWGGRDATRDEAATLRTVYEHHGALVPPSGFGRTMTAPTLLEHGDDDQRRRHLTSIQDGTAAWCQLFSEPDAGSDLAGLTTTARLDDHQWVVDGQKVWSSQAATSDMAMLLARTEPDVERHGGISFLLLPMDQPGVEVRPLREMTGRALFNEVFLDGARCAEAEVVGGRGHGWAVAATTLRHERASLTAGGNHPVGRYPGPKGGMLHRRAGDVVADGPERPSTLRAEDVADLLAARGDATDPLLRDRIAKLVSAQCVLAWTNARLAGDPTGAAMSKLASTAVVKDAAEAALTILGADGQLTGADGTDGGHYAHAFQFSAASSIYGGTDQIQRNILAERNLGLPRERH